MKVKRPETRTKNEPMPLKNINFGMGPKIDPYHYKRPLHPAGAQLHLGVSVSIVPYRSIAALNPTVDIPFLGSRLIEFFF